MSESATSCTRWGVQQPCLRRRSLPASQGAPRASLPPPLVVPAGERPNPRNNLLRSAKTAQFGKKASQQSHEVATKQARKTACHPRGYPCDQALPSKVPRPCRQRPSASSCAQPRANMQARSSQQIPLQILSPRAPGTHSLPTVLATHLQSGPLPVYSLSGG